MTTFTWLTPPTPAAIAVVTITPRPCLDRPLPAVDSARFARLVARSGVVVDEIIACRITDNRLDLHVHGGAGIRAAVSTCLSDWDLVECPSHATTENEPWQRLATAAHPAAVALLLAGDVPATAVPFLTRQPMVLIAGPANAGKSTLLNAWCGRDRALVTDIPGTTRDLVTAEALTLGWRLRLVDSAGERPTTDPLEHAGQQLALTARARADVVLYLCPPEGGDPQPGDVIVTAHADRGGAGELRWSCHGLPDSDATSLLNGLQRAVLDRLGLPAD